MFDHSPNGKQRLCHVSYRPAGKLSPASLTTVASIEFGKLNLMG